MPPAALLPPPTVAAALPSPPSAPSDAPPPAPTRYTTEFIDDEDVYNGEAGAQLASDLAGWTAAAVISVVLAHGDKLIGKNF